MTRAELESLVDRRVEALRSHSPQRLAQLYADDAVVESPMFATLRGRKAVEESNWAFFETFPDLEVATDAIVIDAPRVALFMTYQATHVGEIFGLPGTHRRIHFPVSHLLTYQEGLVAH